MHLDTTKVLQGVWIFNKALAEGADMGPMDGARDTAFWKVPPVIMLPAIDMVAENGNTLPHPRMLNLR